MIKSIRLQNFFGFQDCTINLEKGENVLVGINGSGKSNFFKAIRFLKDAVEGKAIKNLVYNEWGSPDNVFFLGLKHRITPIQFSIQFIFDGSIINPSIKGIQVKDIKYDITIGLGQPNAPSIKEIITLSADDIQEVVVFKNINGDTSQLPGNKIGATNPEMKSMEASDKTETAFSATNQIPTILALLRSYIQGISVYSFFDTTKKSEIRKPVVPLNQVKLLDDGSNLTQILSWLKQNQKIAFSKINDQLEKVSNVFTRIDFLPLGTHIQLQLDEKHLNKPTPAINVSDGTLKFLCLMAVLYNPNRGNLICFDEPELGLHPDMILTLSEAIKYAAETSQIIISTHSPELLNHFNVENIRVFEKNDNNATIVNQYEVDQFDNFMNKYMPGQLWRQGHLGGNRW